MINGESRNWIRFLITLESFYTIYGKWPSTIRLYPFFIEELQTKLSLADFNTLQNKIHLIADEENSFYAADEFGNSFSYMRESPPERNSLYKAIEWLNINEPHYYD